MQKITPFLWFDKEAEEAMNFYISVIPENSEIISMNKGPDGNLFTGSLKLGGSDFMVMNAGPQFKPTPAISFTIQIPGEEEVKRVFNRLSEGGNVLMPLDKYPFSELYGWTNDKYGFSWQVIIGDTLKITPSFLFVGAQNGRVEDALNFYTSLFPNSKINLISRYKEGEGDTVGNINYSSFVLDGNDFIAMESGLDHKFTFTEGVSLFVNCKDQAEVDELWGKLITDGGEESMCGWLKDKYGVSWQIIPESLDKYLYDPDPIKATNAMNAMLKMKKINIEEIKKATQS